MAVGLRRMADEKIAEWLAIDRDNYIRERITAGDDAATATRTADEQLAQAFPDGKPAPGQHVFHIVDGDDPVGVIWIGEAPNGPTGLWWVFDVEIDESRRGRGAGRAAMRLAEDKVRELGGDRLGLNVFGHNEGARRLYEDLGYRTVAVRMEKTL